MPRSDASKACAVPWKVVVSVAGSLHIGLQGANAVDRRAERNVGRQVERDRDRWQLTLMVDRQRRDTVRSGSPPPAAEPGGRWAMRM